MFIGATSRSSQPIFVSDLTRRLTGITLITLAVVSRGAMRQKERNLKARVGLTGLTPTIY